MADETLNIRITVDTSQAKGALGGLKGALGGLGSIINTGLGVALGGLITTAVPALIGGFGDVITSAMDAEKGQAALAAVLKSTGGAAGVSAEMANGLASAFQKTTMFSDDATLAGENLLLTFTGIGKEVFPEATKTMLDMSQALGQDMKSSAVQLGKALNDPIQGISALSRVGVSFTDAQKDQIKALQESGDLMGAQKLILAELQKEFGGAAEAAGGTFAGKMAILGNAFDDIKESIGGAFLPMLTQVADALSKLLADPAVQAGIQNFVAGLTTGFAQLGTLLQGVMPFIQNLGAAIQGLFAGGGGDSGFMAWLGELGAALNEAGAAIMSGLQPALVALQPAWDAFAAVVGPLVNEGLKALGEIITGVVIPSITKFILTALAGAPAFTALALTIGGKLNEAIGGAKALWDGLVTGFQNAVGFIGDVKKGLDDLAGVINGAITTALTTFNTNVLIPIRDTFSAIVDFIQGVLDKLRELADILGMNVSGLRDAFGAMIPHFAGGTNFAPGGLAIVGERGPELVHLPRGSQVVPNGGFGMGGAMVQVVYAPVLSTGTQYELERALTPIVQAIVRKIR